MNNSPEEDLLRPRDVAAIFGVRTATIARWAREGRLTPLRTPGGHRRYTRAAVRAVLTDEAQAQDAADAERMIAADAVRLYDQAWSIRQVAERFGCGYGVMRRVLARRTTLRDRRGGREVQAHADSAVTANLHRVARAAAPHV